MHDFLRDPIRESATIHAPIERCWALSIRVELVQQTLGMNLAGGVTTGSIEAGSRVLWRGWKFGLLTKHHTLITRFEPPHVHSMRYDGHEITREARFQDTQERGRFAFFQHDHKLSEENSSQPHTILEDEIRFAMPFGIAGRMVGQWLMEPYIRRLARQRFAMLKRIAESNEWRDWV